MRTTASAILIGLLFTGCALTSTGGEEPDEIPEPTTTAAPTTVVTTTVPTTTTMPPEEVAFVGQYRALYPETTLTTDELVVMGSELCKQVADAVNLPGNEEERVQAMLTEQQAQFGDVAAENSLAAMILATETLCPDRELVLAAAIELLAAETAAADYEAGWQAGHEDGVHDGLAGAWAYSEPNATSESFVAGYAAGYEAGNDEGLEVLLEEQQQIEREQRAALEQQQQAEFERWCVEYKLALEAQGDERARNTPSNPIRMPGEEPSYFFAMNYGMYQDWVADPLEEAGCPRPAGY